MSGAAKGIEIYADRVSAQRKLDAEKKEDAETDALAEAAAQRQAEKAARDAEAHGWAKTHFEQEQADRPAAWAKDMLDIRGKANTEKRAQESHIIDSNNKVTGEQRAAAKAEWERKENIMGAEEQRFARTFKLITENNLPGALMAFNLGKEEKDPNFAAEIGPATESKDAKGNRLTPWKSDDLQVTYADGRTDVFPRTGFINASIRNRKASGGGAAGGGAQGQGAIDEAATVNGEPIVGGGEEFSGQVVAPGEMSRFENEFFKDYKEPDVDSTNAASKADYDRKMAVIRSAALEGRSFAEIAEMAGVQPREPEGDGASVAEAYKEKKAALTSARTEFSRAQDAGDTKAALKSKTNLDRAQEEYNQVAAGYRDPSKKKFTFTKPQAPEQRRPVRLPARQAAGPGALEQSTGTSAPMGKAQEYDSNRDGNLDERDEMVQSAMFIESLDPAQIQALLGDGRLSPKDVEDAKIIMKLYRANRQSQLAPKMAAVPALR